jgi:hypothetical protein
MSPIGSAQGISPLRDLKKILSPFDIEGDRFDFSSPHPFKRQLIQTRTHDKKALLLSRAAGL